MLRLHPRTIPMTNSQLPVIDGLSISEENDLRTGFAFANHGWVGVVLYAVTGDVFVLKVGVRE